MKEDKTSALYSAYMIDGVPQSLTPAQMLSELSMTPLPACACSTPSPIVDETLECGVGVYNLDPSLMEDYLKLALEPDGEVPIAHCGSHSSRALANALIDAIWRGGHFRLQDLCVHARWSWNASQMGSMAAFYESVRSTCDYADSLDLRFSAVDYMEGPLGVNFSTRALQSEDEDGNAVFIGRELAHPAVIQDDPQSWLIYVPFETSAFRLGGSLLSRRLKLSGGAGVSLEDPDYFLDCYEVVRELVEDGIVVAGATVGEGGLLPALHRMCTKGIGACISVSDIMKAYSEPERLRILFSEVPGAIIQVKDIDFDYVDAEFLLQDVAFFPLGHPVRNKLGVEVQQASRTGIENILDSLMRAGSGAEGED